MSKQWSKEPSKRFAATGVFYTEFSLECGTVIVDPLGHETTLGYTSRAQAEYDCNVMNDAAQRLAQPQPAPVDAMREALEACLETLQAQSKNCLCQGTGGRSHETTNGAEVSVDCVDGCARQIWAINKARTALAAAKEGKNV